LLIALLLVLAVGARGQAAEGPVVDEAELGLTRPKVEGEPRVLENLVDRTLELANVPPTAGNTPAHYGIAVGILLVTVILRRVVVRGIFGLLRNLAGRTRSKLDTRLVRAVERPAMVFVSLLGLFMALRVLRLPWSVERVIGWAATFAFSLVLLVFFLRLFSALLDHAQHVARIRQLNVAAFMPWIRRTVLTMVFILGVLMIASHLGADVRAFLAGLGIGGLAVALAAQDTLANIFGSVVIAIDQPFRIGENVQIGPHSGAVEDIGLRSTRLRTGAKHVITIPNKTVAAEAISNLTRFTQRRVEQTLRLAYDTTPGQIRALVESVRAIIEREAEVEPASIQVHFTEIGAVSLDIWLAYQTLSPDWIAQMKLRQRINLAIMEEVAAHGARFAPNQRVELQTSAPGGAETARDEATRIG
jgi:MscS family membrane protein